MDIRSISSVITVMGFSRLCTYLFTMYFPDKATRENQLLVSTAGVFLALFVVGLLRVYVFAEPEAKKDGKVAPASAKSPANKSAPKSTPGKSPAPAAATPERRSERVRAKKIAE